MIEIAGPHGVTQPGDALTINVEVEANDPNLKYFWTVRHGAIEVGQGTRSIVVRSSMDDDAGQDVEATVLIDGIPAGCSKSASGTARIAPMLPWESWDEWGSSLPIGFIFYTATHITSDFSIFRQIKRTDGG